MLLYVKLHWRLSTTYCRVVDMLLVLWGVLILLVLFECNVKQELPNFDVHLMLTNLILVSNKNKIRERYLSHQQKDKLLSQVGMQFLNGFIGNE